MNTADKKISEVLAKFGEPMAGNCWRVQGNAVIFHKTLERIAAQAKIHFDEPKIIRAEKDEAVMQVTGRMGDRMEWSIGEACIDQNYRVSGRQAAYPYAMAEKRAKDRVILKLIELHGYVYSEEESDEFKQSALAEGREQSRERVQSGGGKGAREYLDEDREDDRRAQQIEREEPQIRTSPEDRQERGSHLSGDPVDDIQQAGDKIAAGKVEDDLKAKIKKAKTINAVTDLMLHADTQKTLADLPEGIRDEIRDFAKARLVELGWPTKKDGDLKGSAAKTEEPKGSADKMLADLKLITDDFTNITMDPLDLKRRLGGWATANAKAKEGLNARDKARVMKAFETAQIDLAKIMKREG